MSSSKKFLKYIAFSTDNQLSPTLNSEPINFTLLIIIILDVQQKEEIAFSVHNVYDHSSPTLVPLSWAMNFTNLVLVQD